MNECAAVVFLFLRRQSRVARRRRGCDFASVGEMWPDVRSAGPQMK